MCDTRRQSSQPIIKICKKIGCLNIAFYGGVDRIAKYCIDHKRKTSIDIRHCIFPDCIKKPKYEHASNRADFCEEHAYDIRTRNRTGAYDNSRIITYDDSCDDMRGGMHRDTKYDLRQYICHVCQKIDNKEDISHWSQLIGQNLTLPVNVIMECMICKCYGVWTVI